MKKRSKNALSRHSITVGIIIMVGLLGGWLLTQLNKSIPFAFTKKSSNATSSLYINELAGVSIEFPEDWTIPTSIYKETVTLTPDGLGPDHGFQISKFINDNSAAPILALKKHERNLLPYTENQCDWILDPRTSLKKKEIMIDGHKATYLENIKPNMNLNDKDAYYACIVVKGDPEYVIVWHNDTKEKGDIEKILSSFKFLE